MEDSVKQKKQEKIGGKDREKWKQLQGKRTASKAADPSQTESNSLWCQIPVQVHIKTMTRQIYLQLLAYTETFTELLHVRQFSFFWQHRRSVLKIQINKQKKRPKKTTKARCKERVKSIARTYLLLLSELTGYGSWNTWVAVKPKNCLLVSVPYPLQPLMLSRFDPLFLTVLPAVGLGC